MCFLKVDWIYSIYIYIHQFIKYKQILYINVNALLSVSPALLSIDFLSVPPVPRKVYYAEFLLAQWVLERAPWNAYHSGLAFLNKDTGEKCASVMAQRKHCGKCVVSKYWLLLVWSILYLKFAVYGWILFCSLNARKPWLGNCCSPIECFGWELSASHLGVARKVNIFIAEASMNPYMVYPKLMFRLRNSICSDCVM